MLQKYPSLVLLCCFFLSKFSLAFGIEAQHNKAGLAWANGDSIDIHQYTGTGKVSWYYSWSAYPAHNDLEFVPMLWGPGHILEFQETINVTIAQHKITSILGMNEPQEAGQSNLSPEDAAKIWKDNLEPLRSRGLRLGSPAPSSAPSGKTWLQAFLGACSGCNIDFIAFHWYDVNATAFAEYAADMHATFQRPLWVTEWACQNFRPPGSPGAGMQCSEADTALFLNSTQRFLDSTPYIERYAWFGAMRDLHGVNPANALMDGNGKINNLGQQYIGASAPRPSSVGSQNGATPSTSISDHATATTTLLPTWLLRMTPVFSIAWLIFYYP